jgi:4-diphosphocytidyl-2-C-methyl-D-erythritol kinase
MFRLGLTRKMLMERGVKLGADVPYCIMRGTALSEGIGEILTELPAAPQCTIVLAKPQVAVSTKAVYGKLKVNELTSSDHPDIDGMTEAIREKDLDGIISRLGNVLETVTIPAHPEIGTIKQIMLEHGAAGALMSGSGPTVFGIYKDRKAAEAACRYLRQAENGQLARQVYLTGFFQKKTAR